MPCRHSDDNVVSYNFNIEQLIHDAEIAARVDALTTTVPHLSGFDDPNAQAYKDARPSLQYIWHQAGLSPDAPELHADAVKVTNLDGIGPVAAIRLQLPPNVPLPAGLDESSWMWQYRGFHGTSVFGLCGILRDGMVRAMMDGSRGIYARAAASPGPEVRRDLLMQVLTSPSKGAHGLCLELFYQGHQHKMVPKGGVVAEGLACENTYVTHMRQGKENRWTFPEPHTKVVRLWVNCELLSSLDVPQLLDIGDVFAD